MGNDFVWESLHTAVRVTVRVTVGWIKRLLNKYFFTQQSPEQSTARFVWESFHTVTRVTVRVTVGIQGSWAIWKDSQPKWAGDCSGDCWRIKIYIT